MTKQELWQIYCRKNPSFTEKETITMKTEQLKRLFDQTWEMAEQHAASKSKSSGRVPSPFDQIFR